MLLIIWAVGIALKLFTTLVVLSWWIVLLWPLVVMAVLGVLALLGVGIGSALIGIGTRGRRR
jgi:hypothetical protein